MEQTAISGGVGLLIIFVFTEDILNKHSLLGYVCMLPFNVNIVTLQKIFIFTKIIRKDLYIVSLDIFLECSINTLVHFCKHKLKMVRIYL